LVGVVAGGVVGVLLVVAVLVVAVFVVAVVVLCVWVEVVGTVTVFVADAGQLLLERFWTVWTP
jgi:hypothetical protein